MKALKAALLLALLAAPALGQEAVEVFIPPGSTASQTAALLKQKGVVSSPLFFRAWAKMKRLDRDLKPGLYSFRRGSSLPEVLRKLSEGKTVGVRVAIPEGFATWQIAERLEAAGVCKANDFLRYARENRLEGYLFPTTYFFEPNTRVDKVVAKLKDEFKAQIEAAYQAQSPKPRFTLHQLVTLASIVEREAALPRERGTIAAVYLNRMKKRMRLEADPTVQYALGRWKKGLTFADLKYPSPYNTYMNYGLPPGPICSPGLESFKGALNPAASDAIYFVADHTGGHFFTADHNEFLKAKASYKKELKIIKRRLRDEEQRKKLLK